MTGRETDPEAAGDSGDPPGCPDDAVEVPLDGTLDLHAFRPRDVTSVVSEYLDACRERGILHVRIVHGKGIGALRETVHAALVQRADVARFRLDSETGAGWGATLVDLIPPGVPRR
jgi:DNA-nicking Smr family endonuclease